MRVIVGLVEDDGVGVEGVVGFDSAEVANHLVELVSLE